MAKFKFLLEFFKNWTVTGSITPSSRFLIDKMLSNVNFSTAKVIVELGAGEGCVTKEILRRMKKSVKLFSFEINPSFCKLLKEINDKRLIVVNDSAENLQKYVKLSDYVISSLPLGSLPERVGDKITQEVAKVLKFGKYIQYQYSLKSYGKLKSLFNVKLDFTLFNLPPAFVYVCTKRI